MLRVENDRLRAQVAELQAQLDHCLTDVIRWRAEALEQWGTASVEADEHQELLDAHELVVDERDRLAEAHAHLLGEQQRLVTAHELVLDERGRLVAELSALHTTLSWRITSPLRGLQQVRRTLASGE